jgi:hypothetical protein
LVIIDSADFGRREGWSHDHCIHYIVIMLALEGLDGKVHNSQGSLDVLEEFSNRRDPESFEMRGPNVRVFEERGDKARVVLKPVYHNEEHMLGLSGKSDMTHDDP